jgi:uncharacterized protein (DUF305 family)
VAIRALRAVALLGMLAAGAALAQAPQSMPGMHGSAGADAPSSKAYMQAMMRMHQGMDITYTGDADHDFVTGMIPHHQGAVDMAKIELQYGKDPELRRLAQDIVAAQEKEITFMNAWLAKHR